MRNGQAYLFAAVLAVLTLLRMLAPEKALTIRERLAALISREDDYVQMVETMGRQLAEQGLRDGLVAVWDMLESGAIRADGMEETAIPTDSTMAEPEVSTAGELMDGLGTNA